MSEQRETWLPWSDTLLAHDCGIYDYDKATCEVECEEANNGYGGVATDWRPVRIPPPDEIEALERDAARYRYLRDDCWSDEQDVVPCVHLTDENGSPVDELHGDGLDAAIDAAMKGGE